MVKMTKKLEKAIDSLNSDVNRNIELLTNLGMSLDHVGLKDASKIVFAQTSAMQYRLKSFKREMESDN